MIPLRLASFLSLLWREERTVALHQRSSHFTLIFAGHFTTDGQDAAQISQEEEEDGGEEAGGVSGAGTSLPLLKITSYHACRGVAAASNRSALRGSFRYFSVAAMHT